MLTFALGLVSGLAHNLARVSLTSQNGSELPWIRWKGLEANRRSMDEEGSLLGRWRARLIVLALLEPYFLLAEDRKSVV